MLIAWALFLTAVMGAITIHIERTYFEHYSYFFDPISYSFYNARLYTRLADENRLSLVLQEWLNNPRHPLRTIATLLFAPRLLASPIGHMATALPMLFIFLSLLGRTIYVRCQHALYAAACMLLFCAIPVMFYPVLGLGAFWADLPASFLVAGAALCLLNSSEARNLKWLVGFAVLASLAALSRYVAAAYVFVACAPVLLLYLVQRARQEGSVIRNVLTPVAVIAVCIGVLAGYFLIAHYNFNIHYYTVFEYTHGQNIFASLASVMRSMLLFFGAQGLVVLAALALVNGFLFWKFTTRNWGDLLVSLWLAVAEIFLLVVGIREAGADHVAIYAVPLIAFAVASPASFMYATTDQETLLRRWLTMLACALIFIGVLGAGRAAWVNYQYAKHPSRDFQEQKAFDVVLGEAIHREGGALVWIAYFQEYAWIPSMETFYRHGELPLPAGGGFFEDHESMWKGRFPGLSPAEVSERVYANTCQWVDVAVVFDDPAQADANSYMDNPYSRAVAKNVAEQVRTNPQWTRAFVVESTRYGTLVGYRNRDSKRRGYETALRRMAQLTP